MSDRLFTARFFVMFTFSFTVFVSALQLLPAAPYRILELGGTTASAGLFLGFLTFSSAFSAPFTGPIGDRLGHRQVLIVASLILAVCTASYAFIPSYRVLLAVVIVHGLFWSGLLSASGAYMTATVPASRRAEGLSYWGLASVLSLAVAPPIGFWVREHYGWSVLCGELVVLNLAMAVIAWRLPDDRAAHAALMAAAPPARFVDLIEWRVMILSVAMALIAFGYGAITSFSALLADHLAVQPSTLFLTAMATTILVGRLVVSRALDRVGHRRAFLRALAGPPIGLALLAMAQGRLSLAFAGVVFGAGFGLVYPAFSAFVIDRVGFARRGAAFGAMLAAFDTGMGTGSSLMGWLIHGMGFRRAFAVAAGLAVLAVPSFLMAERRLGFRLPRS